MTIQWTGTNGLFTRIGKIGKVLADMNTYQRTTLPTDIHSLENQYDSNLYLIDNIETSLLSSQQSVGSYMSYLQQVGQDTVNDMVFLDNPLLSASDIGLSLAEVIRQMKASGQTVNRCTTTLTSVAASGNVGNGVIVTSTKDFQGLVQEDLFAEKLICKVTADQNDNSANAGHESFTVSTQVGYDPFDWRWPLGSQTTNSLQAINGMTDNGNGNLLTNSSFLTFTTNVPTNWVLAVGSAGTTIKASSNAYTGASSVQFVGTAASAQTAIQQTFNVSSSGTAGALAALNQYAFSCWLYLDNPTANPGVFSVSVIDGNGAVVNDYQGTANTASKTLSTLSASAWTNFNGVFRTPQVMPSTLKVKAGLSSALASGTNLYLDRMGFGSMTQVYAGGPSLAAFSGSASFYDADYLTVTSTNDRAGASGTLLTFQTLFDRLFDMRDLGFLLPSAASGTISDSLIS